MQPQGPNPSEPDPATADPATADPATVDPATVDPATADPATADPATAPTMVTPTTASGAGGRRVRPGDLLVAGGGALVVLASFAPFVAYDGALVDTVGGPNANFDGRYSAWSAQTFMAPLTWFVVVAGLLLATLAGVRLVRGGNPAGLGITAAQAQLGLALFAFFVLLGYALSAKDMMFGLDTVNDEMRALLDFPLSSAWGGLLMLLGAAVALAGAVLNHLAAASALPSAPATAQPAAPYQAAYPPPVEFHQQPGGGLPQSRPYPPPVEFHQQGPEQGGQRPS